MRLTRLALAMTFGLGLAAPAIAQTTALPGAATQTRPVAPPTAPKAMAPKPMAMAPMGAPVNVNTATEAQLDTVPQIGPKRAAAIIKNRPYRSLDELVSKKALSSGIFEKVKSHLTV